MNRTERFVKVAAKAAFALADVGFGPFPGPRVLIYHQIGTNLEREMEVSTDTFRRQLDWMQERGLIVDLDDAVRRRAEPGADKLFVLTFDDGYSDMYENAFPLLRERCLPFTLYLTTRPIETGKPLDHAYPGAGPLKWEQVNDMLATGLATVGAHTHTHRDLRHLTETEILEELETCDTLIAKNTSVDPQHFAYPKGWWTAAADPKVRARYRTAVLGSGLPFSADRDPHLINRVPIQSTDYFLYAIRKLRTGMRLEDFVRRRLDGYTGP